MDLSNINSNRQETNPISRMSSDDSDKDVFVFNSRSVDAVNSSYIRNKSKLSNGSITSRTEGSDMNNAINFNWKGKAIRESPVWCMDFCNDLIILGCSDGRLEFWEASSGKLLVRLANIMYKIYRIIQTFSTIVYKNLTYNCNSAMHKHSLYCFTTRANTAIMGAKDMLARHLIQMSGA